MYLSAGARARPAATAPLSQITSTVRPQPSSLAHDSLVTSILEPWTVAVHEILQLYEVPFPLIFVPGMTAFGFLCMVVGVTGQH